MKRSFRMTHWLLAGLFVLLVLAVANDLASAAAPEKIYYVDLGRLYRNNLDGSNEEVLYRRTGLYQFAAVAVDVTHRKVYTSENNRINLSDLDGTNKTTIISGLSGNVTSLDVDERNGKIYWTQKLKGNKCSGDDCTIRRANLDGTDQETIVCCADAYGASYKNPPGMIMVDARNGWIYWGAQPYIKRAQLDGNNVQIFSDGFAPGYWTGFAIDAANEHIYWTSYYSSYTYLKRNNFDGSGEVSLIANPGPRPRGIVLDLPGGKMYWAHMNGVDSANLNGSNQQRVASHYLCVSVDLGPGDGPSNLPPNCSGAAIADQSADGNCQGTISGADVTGVTDPDGDDLTITVDPTTLDLGDNYVTVTADDGNGGNCSTDIIVSVVDNTDPVMSVGTETLGMWPPNHKYKTFMVADFDVSASDNCGSVSVAITNVTSNEDDDAKGGGDGNTTDDIVLVNSTTVKLRAERDGSGDGRVYTITVTAEDGSGNTIQATCEVIVPHDRSGLPKNIGSQFVGDDMVIPGDYQLSQNYPNPFNPTTEITFALPQAETVKLSIYNTNGQLIRTLVNGFYSEGFHTVMWNATDESGSRVTSGMYVYVLRAGEVILQNKMLLMK
jgi:hypothetical protein